MNRDLLSIVRVILLAMVPGVVLGQSPDHQNLYFAFGHGHQGLLGASKTGQVIAELLGGRAASMDMHPFRIDRFS